MIRVHDKQFIPFITSTEIESIIDKISIRLNHDLKDQNPIFLIIMNGGLMFASDLLRKFHGSCEIHGIKISSYIGLESSGEVEIASNWTFNPSGRNIVIIEDIIDTGKTLSKFIGVLSERSPQSIRVATLLYKPQSIVHQVNADYIGKEIGSSFVIGYGLDYNEQGRNLPEIYVLDSFDN